MKWNSDRNRSAGAAAARPRVASGTRAAGSDILTDYGRYRMPVRERVFCMLKAGIIISVISYIFFMSAWFSAACFILGAVYPRIKSREIVRRRKHELLLQFKDLLQSLSSSVSAGKPLETAFRESWKDLNVIYQEPDIPILREIALISRRIGANETIEAAFADFAMRSGLEDIMNFSYTVSTCKRAGGDLPGIIANTVSIIGDKIDMSYEVDVILAERKMEQKILVFLPVFLVAILSFTAGGYMQPVFTTVIGRLAMILALSLFASGYLISMKIMNIKM